MASVGDAAPAGTASYSTRVHCCRVTPPAGATFAGPRVAVVGLLAPLLPLALAGLLLAPLQKRLVLVLVLELELDTGRRPP